MKQILLLLALLVSAISAEAQGVELPAEKAEAVDRSILVTPHFADNWSLSLAGGVYHPMFFDLKYLVDCSGWAGSLELRKQLTPVIGLGLEADGYYRMTRKERRDPRTVIGPMFHINLMNLFGGYKGKPRIFEIDVDLMPAWGHLYRGSQYDLFPDENYFATKYGLDFNFNLGRSGAWTLSLKPAIVCDITSRAPTPGTVTSPYDSYVLEHSDIQLFVGFAYRFRNHGGTRNFRFGTPAVERGEIERLNEIVNFLRDDVQQRDRQIRDLKLENDSLRQQLK